MAKPQSIPVTQRLERWPGDACESLPDRFLVCLTGPEVARAVSFENERMLLGRTADCDFVLSGAGVSRRHCLLRLEPQGAVLEDLGSTNGTLLNEKPLATRGHHVVYSGDVIRLGDVAVKYLERDHLEARYYEAVLRLTGVDALTQLKNRRFMLELLEREIARADRHQRTLSIVMIDLDRFKEINDTFGHLAGDSALQHVGATLARATRREDCAGRLGGDEFLVLLPETAAQGAMLFADRLCKRFARDGFPHAGEHLPLTVSAGVASWQTGIKDSSDLLVVADQALYAAKRAGRDQASAGA